MTRRIFRAVALQRYNNRLEKLVLPRYASPPWVLVGWGLCGLLLAFTALLWSARIPIYVSGPGVVIETPATLGDPKQAMVAVLLPETSAAQVRANQNAFLQFAGPGGFEVGGPLTGEVAIVEPEAISPAFARARYDLDASAGLLVDGPVVVALIPLDVPLARWLGGVGEVRIEVGSQRGLALLPGLGRLFADMSTP